MRLVRFIIRNFKGISIVDLTVPKTDTTRPGSADFLSIVGENNCSKSTVLEALRLVMPGTDLSKPSIDHFPNRNENNGPVEIELIFDDLTAEDLNEQGIRTHIHNNQYRIKKTWQTPNTTPAIFAYEQPYEFPTWPDPDTTRAHFEDAGNSWPEIIALYQERYGDFPQRVTKQIRENLKNLIREVGSPLCVRGEAIWQENPGGFSAHVDSVLPKVIYIPAIRETKEEAEVTQKKSAVRQIVETMFSRQLAGHEAIMRFSEAGEAVKQLFAGEDGHEIIRGVERRISDKLQRLIDLNATLDFSPPDLTADLASRTILEICDGECKTRPEHQGHGAQRALIISLLELLAEEAAEGPSRKILLLIEEPEIYLHPQMCRKMRDVILSIARSGTAQVICTTHSPVFLDLADRHDGIAIFKKAGNGLVTLQRTEDIYGGTNAIEQRNRLRMILDFNPTVNEVFFGKEACLVEGDSEIAAIEAIAKKLISQGRIDRNKYMLARRELVIVNCSGKWTITAFQRVLNGFAIPYRVVHDSDTEGTGGANQAILQLINHREDRRMVHNPNFEQHHFGEIGRAHV